MADKKPRTTFSEELVDKVVEAVSAGRPLAQICRELNITLSAWYVWAEKHQGVSGRIAQARLDGYDAIAQEAMEIANTPITGEETEYDGNGVLTKIKRADMIAHRKLQVETRLKLLAKWDPKRYGDRVQNEITGANGGPVQTLDTTKLDSSTLEAILAAKIKPD